MAYTEINKAIMLMPDRLKTMWPQLWRNSYLFHRMVAGARRYKIYDELELPFYISPPSAGGWIGRNSTLPEAQQSIKAMGSERNAYLAVPMSWDMFDEWELDDNPNAIFPFLDQQAMEMAWAKMRNMSAAVFNGTGGEQPLGLAYALEKLAPGSQVKVIHGVNKATKAWYRNGYVQLTANFGTIAAGTTLPAGILAFRTAVKASRLGGNQCSDVVTTQDIFDTFERYFLEIDTPQRAISKEEDAYLGFRRFNIFGTYLTWDDNCPTDSIYFLRIGGKGDKMHEQTFGDKKNKTDIDWDFEQAASQAKFDTDVSISIASNPNVKDVVIEPRTSLRGLQKAKWVVDSYQQIFPNMNKLVVAGSDNGSRWSTWS